MDYNIFEEMTLEEIATYLETGEVPVRTDFGNAKKDLPKGTGHHEGEGDTPVRTDFGNAKKDLPKDTGFHKDQGDTPIRDNTVETKPGHDKVKPTNGDVKDFAKAEETEVIEEGCKKEEKCDCGKKDCPICSKKKKPVEADEIEKDSDTLEEDFDVDSEYDALVKSEEADLLAFDEELKDLESFLENYKEEE